MRSPRRATAKTSSTLGGRRRKATSAAPVVDERGGILRARRVANAVEPVAIDELDVELALHATRRARRSPGDTRPRRAIANGSAARRERLVEVATGSPSRAREDRAPRRRGASGKTCRPSGRRDDERHDPRPGRAELAPRSTRSRSDGGRRRRAARSPNEPRSASTEAATGGCRRPRDRGSRSGASRPSAASVRRKIGSGCTRIARSRSRRSSRMRGCVRSCGRTCPVS